MFRLPLALMLTFLVCALFCTAPALQNNSWAAKDFPNFRIQFFDSQTGFILGPRLLRTSNRGVSWDVIEYPRVEDSIRAEAGPEYRKYYVDFVDRDWGWRLSTMDLNAVESTENGGVTWSPPVKFGNEVFYRALVFVSRDKGWVMGERIVMKTEDRGRHWTEEVALRNSELKYPYFLDQENGWIIGEHGILARTSDGGRHWVVGQTSLKYPTCLFFITEKIGWAVGEDGLVARTEDGGSNWSRQDVPVPYDARQRSYTKLLDVFFKTPEIGWISGYNGLILTTVNGGRTWTKVSTPTKAPLSSIRFVDALHGWSVGGFREAIMGPAGPTNVVIESVDGGQSWKTRDFK